MPKLDLESLRRRRGSHDPAVTLSSLISDADAADESGTGAGDPYAPAASLRLLIGEDIDWSEVGAVLERDDSTKGAANPKSAARRSAAAPAAGRSSCAATGVPKAVAVVIGGLPAAGNAAREHARRRRRSSRLRRARVFAAGEAAGAEPSSPKVSCLGGVRPRQWSEMEMKPAEAGRRGWWLSLACCCWSPCQWRPRGNGSNFN